MRTSAAVATLMLLVACSQSPYRPDTSTGGPGVPPVGGATLDGGAQRDGFGGEGGALQGRCNAPASILDNFKAKRTIYVSSTSGSDSNDGTGPDRAWKSLANAESLEPGDEVILVKGTYPCGITITDQGDAENPIWIHSETSRDAVFDCLGDSFGFRLSNAAFVAISQVEVRSAQENGILIQGNAGTGNLAKNIEIIDSSIHDLGIAGIRVEGATNVSLLGNTIARTSAYGARLEAHGISAVGVFDSRIEANTIDTIGGQTNAGITVQGGSARVSIAQNRISNAPTGISLGGLTERSLFAQGETFEARNLVAHSNIFSGEFTSAFTASGCSTCLVGYNTVAVNRSDNVFAATPGSSAAGGQSHSENLAFEGNIVVWLRSKPVSVFNLLPAENGGFAQANNIYFWTAGSLSSVASSPAIEGDGSRVDQDPSLVNPTAGDVRLLDGSPATGAGTENPNVAFDFSGACRTRHSLGAWD